MFDLQAIQSPRFAWDKRQAGDAIACLGEKLAHTVSLLGWTDHAFFLNA